MPPLNSTPHGQQVFRTLNDLQASPEVERQLARFLPEDADRELVAEDLKAVVNGDEDDGHDPARTARRRFLKLMGASMALAGLAACRWPEQRILPYNQRPEGRVPGIPEQFATTHEVDGYSRGLLVTSFDGRPIKVEGNPSHPINGASYTVNGKERPAGAATAQDQGAILDLYDPDRSKGPKRRTPTGYVSIDRTLFQGHWLRRMDEIGAGQNLVVLAEPSSSPSLRQMRAKLLERFPQATWLEYAAISRDNEREGLKLFYGEALRPQLHLAEASTIVVFDEDLFNEHPASLRYARDFATGRRVKLDDNRRASTYDPFGEEVERPFLNNRLYAIEANFSATGASADHRYPVAASHIGAALAQVARHVFTELGEDGANGQLLTGLGDGAPLAANRAQAIAKDLVANRGRAVVAVGPRQAPEVHALAAALNRVLRAVGNTLTYTRDDANGRNEERLTHAQALVQLAQRIEQGTVTDLVVLGANPVYTAPAELGLAEKLGTVPHSVHLGTHYDETGRNCGWHLAKSHFLEAWGDSLAYDGTVGMQQPLIDPMYDSVSAIELLNLLATGHWRKGHDLVQEAWRDLWQVGGVGSASFQRRWRQALHDGVQHDSGGQPQRLLATVDSPRPRLENPADVAQRASAMPEVGPGAFEVVLVPDTRLYDGRYANNGWLQETPEYLTTLTWGNALVVGLRAAKELGVSVSIDDVADEVSVFAEHLDQPIDVPVYVMPGLPAHSAVLWLGFGRTDAGTIAGNQSDVATVGVNAYPLRGADGSSVIRNVRIRKKGTRQPLALYQNHWRIDQVGAAGRQERIGHLVRTTTLEAYTENPKWVGYPYFDHFPADRAENLWEAPYKYDQPASPGGADPQWSEQPHYKWGMAIDLSACIGCNACLVACTAENNIPVVGKDEMRNNRDMHWIRQDRYFTGPQLSDDPRDIDEEEVHVLNQVVMCVHCETAPCEQVCPVAATVHDHHGLNVMIYNRCIGTRYCSNNCPYKVRRFNYFYNHRNVTEVEKMRFNPNVTVRSRGVMEKCTYCVQRIELTKQFAKADNNRRVEDGEIVPACAQTCPTHAIVFGDLNDEQSAVSKLVRINKSYNLLNDRNTKPRTKYLGAIRNPNPELER